jgi:hypothetical protein
VTWPASAAALQELVRVTVVALDVPDDQPGAVLVAAAGTANTLRVVIRDGFSADAVRWATGVLRLLGRGPPDAA